MNKNYKIKKQIKFIGVIVVLALNGFVLGNINNSVYTKKASGANLVLALNMVNKSKMGQNNLDRNQANFLIDEEDEDTDNVDFSFVFNNNSVFNNNGMGQNNLDRNQVNFVVDEENEDNNNVDFSFVFNNNSVFNNNRMGQNNLNRNQINFVFDEDNGNQKQK